MSADITPYQSQYFAWLLSRRMGAASANLLASTVLDAQVDLNPHQVEAALLMGSWQGGGGFRYYELASTLLSTDRWGNLVINPEYDAAMLAGAMCKLEGFSYAPSEVLWWQQGRSSEWGHDDYSLNVANLPMAQKKPAEPAQDDLFGLNSETASRNSDRAAQPEASE